MLQPLLERADTHQAFDRLKMKTTKDEALTNPSSPAKVCQSKMKNQQTRMKWQVKKQKSKM